MNKEVLREAVHILKKEEGWRAYIYDDANGQRLKKGDTIIGHPTAMYGFTRFTNERISYELYELFPRWGDLGLALLVKRIIDYDLLHFSRYVAHLNKERIVVLVCMIFQMGVHGVLGFSNMLKAILNDDFDTASQEGLDSVWANINSPARAKRMMNIMKTGKFN